jgi:hypothetical protein
MKTTQKTANGWTTVMRWVARLLALVAAGLFVYSAIEFGGRILPALSWTSPQGIPLLAVLIVSIAGALIAWRWELVGGVMTLAGAVIVIALVCAGSGVDMFLCALLFTLPMLVAGVLYLGCCWRRRAARLAEKA